jgi:hypothetical protein
MPGSAFPFNLQGELNRKRCARDQRRSPQLATCPVCATGLTYGSLAKSARAPATVRRHRVTMSGLVCK